MRCGAISGTMRLSSWNCARGGVAMSSVNTWDPVAPPRPAPPEDALYEIVDGQYEELPPMSTQASIVASRLVVELSVFAKGHRLGEVVGETLFGLTPKSRRKYRLDAAFVS